jgi:hypothetical protein
MKATTQPAAMYMSFREVVARWPLAPGTEPTGMAFDATHHRLFVGCHNKLMVMVDTELEKLLPRCRSAPVLMAARSTTRRNLHLHHAAMGPRRSRKKKLRRSLQPFKHSKLSAARTQLGSIRRRIGSIYPHSAWQ